MENIQRESRRYAKRQLTWFAREPDIHYLYMDELYSIDNALKECINTLKSHGLYTDAGFNEGGNAIE